MSQTATCELVQALTLDGLSDAVTSRMIEGWWPLGRPFTRGEHFIQAMVFEPRASDRDHSLEENCSAIAVE
jgi:hypothetical protein